MRTSSGARVDGVEDEAEVDVEAFRRKEATPKTSTAQLRSAARRAAVW